MTIEYRRDPNGVPVVRPCVAQLPHYQVSTSPESVAKSFGVERIIYLASNENPFGCSPSVTRAVATLSGREHRYPDSSGQHLKTSVAQTNVVTAQQVFLGNGSNEILESVARAYLEVGDNIVISDHSFAMYPIFATCAGADVISVPMSHWTVDLRAMLNAITEQTKIVYFANANNPTGTMLPLSEIVDFLNRVPKYVVVVVDEAYIEFADNEFKSAVSLIEQNRNLLVSRTFSKAYGLAGFRVGYGLANEGLVAQLERIQQPFNVNAVAQIAAVAALSDTQFLQDIIERNRENRTLMAQTLSQLGLTVMPSQANFITVELPETALQCYEYLLSQGIIVRPLTGYQMNNWLRISIGTEAENALLLSAMQAFIEAQHAK